ncbi:MAG: sulfatase-like hydrolase/transferase, partial [Muribaculaceae bacterium]|nr:sulfatase-like hydrolase/transferase [Muribaculaceae bacterium]
MVLLGSSAPLSMQIFAGKSVTHYLLYAFSTCVLEAYILCLFLLFIKWRPLKTAIKVVVYLYFGLFATLMVGTGVLLKSAFNADILGLIAETDVTEAGGFFKAFMSWKAFLLLCVSILFLILFALGVKGIRRLFPLSGRISIPAAILLTIILGYGAKTAVYMTKGFATPYSLRRNIAQPGRPDLKFGFQALFADPLFKSIDIVEEYRINYSDLADWEQLQSLAMKEPLEADTARHFHIAIVIGESFIRSHSSLYGYPLPTNPRLGEELASGRLILFGDMTSPANMTTESVRNTLNLNDISSGEKWCEGIYFPSLLKKAGWNVYHYDNQTVNKSSDVGIAGVFYSDFVMEHVLDGKSDRTFPYDMEYVEYTERQLSRRKSGKTFVIYHLLGQHFPASMRYEGSPRFTPGDIVAPGLDNDDRQLVADYD